MCSVLISGMHVAISTEVHDLECPTGTWGSGGAMFISLPGGMVRYSSVSTEKRHGRLQCVATAKIPALTAPLSFGSLSVANWALCL